jgi:hypothetical protein
MAGIKPFFVTGDKVKIVLNGKTLAFATEFSASVQILTQTPHVLGMYEGTSVEPLGYNVTGSFAIVRYVKNAQGNIGGTAPNGVDPSDQGNGVGSWGDTAAGVLGGFAGITGGLPGVGRASSQDGRADEALNPATYNQGTTFDIEVFQKQPNGDPLGIIKIRSVRISKADFSINKKNAGYDRFEFVGLYMDGDNFYAQSSGGGQQNSS